MKMASQQDLYFAEYVIKKGFASTTRVQEAFDILSRLKAEAGIDDTLSGVMLIKGYINEAQVDQIRLLMDKDGIVVRLAVPAPPKPEAEPPQKAAVPPPQKTAQPSEGEAEDAKLKFHLDSAGLKEESGDLVGAILSLNQARIYARSGEDIESKIRALKGRVKREDLESKYDRYKNEVNARAKVQDFESALSAAEVARDFAADTAEMDAAIAKLKSAALKKRERDAWNQAIAGDTREALRTLQGARNFADPGTLKKMMLEINQSADMRLSTDRYLATAESYIKKNNIHAALEIYTKLARILTDPKDLLQKIDGLKKTAFDMLMVEARKKEWIGDFDAAVEACEKARQYTRALDSVDRKISALRRKADGARKYKSLREEGIARIGKGDLDGGLKNLKEALEYAEKKEEFQVFIDGLVRGRYENLLAEVASAERKLDLKAAIAAAKEALVFAPAPKAEETQALVQRLAEKLADEERGEKFRSINAEAGELLARGDATKAIERLKAARAFAGNPQTVDDRIAKVAGEQFEKGIAEAKALRNLGRLEDAIARAENLAPWARGREEALKNAINEIKVQIERRKKEEGYLVSLRAAEDALQRGDVRTALSNFDLAAEWEEKKDSVAARTREVIKSECVKAEAAADALGAEGHHAEAATLLRDAAKWARGMEKELGERAGKHDKLEEEARKRRAFGAAAAEADGLAKSGDIRGAIRKLKEARPFEMKTGETDAIIEKMGRMAVDAAEAKARDKIRQALPSDAELLVEEAARWAGEMNVPFEERRKALADAVTELKGMAQYRELRSEAEKLYSENSVKKALRKLEEARKLAKDPSDVDARSEEIRKETLGKHMADVERLIAEEDYKWAIVSCELAKEYATSAEGKEIESRIEDLRGYTKTKERKEAFEKIKAEAVDLRDDGRLAQAIERYTEAKALAEDPAGVDAEIQAWKDGEFGRHMKAAEDMLAARRFDAAREEAVKAEEWDSSGRASGLAERISREAVEHERTSKFDKALEEAESCAARGETWKAVDALNSLRSCSPRGFDVDGRISAIVSEKFESRMREARAALRGSDFGAALAAAESAREFAQGRESELEPQIAQIKTEIQARQRRTRLDEMKEKAANLLKAGDAKAAAAILSEAAGLVGSSGEIDREITGIRASELRKALAEADELIAAFRLDEAEKAAERAKLWAEGREEEADRRIEAIKLAKGRAEEEDRYRRIVKEAEERYTKGDTAGALDSLRFALQYASRKEDVDARMKQISAATYEKFIEESRVREGAGMFEEALESCEMAREWAGGRAAELDARVSDLRIKIEVRGRLDRWRTVETEVRAKIETQDIEGAIDVLEKEIALAPNPEEVKLTVADLRNREFEAAVAKARKTASSGEIEKALDTLNKARKWATGREADLEDEIEALGKSAEAGKRHASFKKLEAQALEAEKAGNLKEAVDLWDLAKVYSEDPSVAERKIAEIHSATLEGFLKEAEASEGRMDLEGAIASLKSASIWASGKEANKQVEGEMDRISALIRMESPTDRLARMNTVARPLVADEKAGDAIKRLEISLEVVGDDESVRTRIDEIGLRHVGRYAESAKAELDATNWAGCLAALDKADKLAEAVTRPGADLAAMVENLKAVRRDAEFLRCRSKAMESAKEGDIKAALGFCEEAKVFADDPELLETAMISLVDSAFRKWSDEKEKTKESGEWQAMRDVLRNMAGLFELNGNITKNIWSGKEAVLEELRNAEYMALFGQAAAEETKGNILKGIELLREAGKFTTDPSVVTAEIGRMQLKLFEKFNEDLRRVEADDGVEGAIRFCKAALEYFPEVDLVKNKLKEYSDRWKLKEKRKMFVQYDRAATSAISRGDMPTAVENYLAAAEYSTDPQAILQKIANLIEPVVKEVFEKADKKMAVGDISAALTLCEDAFARFPSSKALQDRCIAMRKEKIDKTTKMMIVAPSEEGSRPAAARWKESGKDGRGKADMEAAHAGKDGILSKVWDTAEFKASELFPGGIPKGPEAEAPTAGEPAKAEERPVEEEQEESVVRPLSLTEPEMAAKETESVAQKAAPEAPPEIEEPPAVKELAPEVAADVEEEEPEAEEETPAPVEGEAEAVTPPAGIELEALTVHEKTEPGRTEEPAEEEEAPEPAPAVLEEEDRGEPEPLAAAEPEAPEPAPAETREESKLPLRPTEEEVTVIPEPAEPAVGRKEAEEGMTAEQRKAKALGIAKRITRIKRKTKMTGAGPKPAGMEEAKPAEAGVSGQAEMPAEEKAPSDIPVATPGTASVEDEATIPFGENLQVKEYLGVQEEKTPVPEPIPSVFADQPEQEKEYEERVEPEAAPAEAEEARAEAEAPREEVPEEPVEPEAAPAEAEEARAEAEAPREEVPEKPVEPEAAPAEAEEARAEADTVPATTTEMEKEPSIDEPATAESSAESEAGEEAVAGGAEEEHAEATAEEGKAEEAAEKPEGAEAGAEATGKAEQGKKKEPKIPVKCANTSCGFELKVPLAHAGKTGRCPKCGKPVKVPMVKGVMKCAACRKIAPIKGGAKVKGKPVCAECVAKIKAKRAK